MLSVHLENGRVTLRTRRRPRRPESHALIRLLCAGICNTDLELQRGYYDFRGTPGHEFVGEVVEADSPALIGKRVVGEINLACGRCDTCLQGFGRHCPKRSVLGIVDQPGVFSEYFTLPEKNLFVVPESIPNESATFVEPLAAACRILEQARIPRGDAVAVLGDGKLGLLIALALQAADLEVHLFGKHRKKLAVAGAAGIPVHRVSGRLPRAAYRWVVEATGKSSGLSDAVRMTRPLGTVLLKSTVHDAVSIDTAEIVVNEINLLGSRCGPFPVALKLLRSGRIDVAPMISERLPLNRAPQAFRIASRRGVLKVLLVCP